MTIGLIPPLLWYAWVIPQWPKEGLIEGVFSENSSISSVFEILWVHLSSTLPELLLNYAAIPLFVAAWYFLGKEKKWMKESFLLMIIWALGVVSYFLYEINMIGTVHDYYLFPFMPMIFILVGFGGWKMITGKNKYMKYLAILALLVVPVTCGLRMAGRWNPEKPGYNPDLLTYQTELRAAVPDDAQVIAGNDLSQFIVLYMIHKKGWVFDKNTLSEEKLVRAMDAGVEYLYSDSRRTESDPRINQYFEEMLYEGGSVKVFKLTSTK